MDGVQYARSVVLCGALGTASHATSAFIQSDPLRGVKLEQISQRTVLLFVSGHTLWPARLGTSACKRPMFSVSARHAASRRAGRPARFGQNLKTSQRALHTHGQNSCPHAKGHVPRYKYGAWTLSA